MASRYRLDPKIPVGMFPALAGQELVNQERKARIEKIGSVGESQGVQVMTKPGWTQKGQRGFSGAGEKTVGDFLPLKSQPGHGAKASNSAVQEDGGPLRFHPMGRGSSFGIRDQCAGP